MLSFTRGSSLTITYECEVNNRILERCLRVWDAGLKVEAISFFREAHPGLSLKDAKTILEHEAAS